MNTTIRVLLSLLLATLVVVTAPLPLQAASSDDEEVKIGQAAARQVEVQFKLVTDKAIGERVARIGQDIAHVSDRPGLPYTYKVIEHPVANAFSLPGGFIYVTKPLLSFVRSDHELAAILAHETAHAAHGHQLEMSRRSNQAMFWTLLIVALTRDPGVLHGAILVSNGLLSGYSRDIERDADLTGISYLVQTAYTPVSMLTVMERLKREEEYSASVDPGAFRDHPRSAERVSYIEADLKRRGIPMIRRVAANYLHVATRTVTEKGQQIGELLVNDTVVVRLPDPARIQAAAARLDSFFNTDPQPYEMTTRATEGGWGIFGGTQLVLTVTTTDAAFLGARVEAAAADITARLRWVIEQDQRMRRFNG